MYVHRYVHTYTVHFRPGRPVPRAWAFGWTCFCRGYDSAWHLRNLKFELGGEHRIAVGAHRLPSSNLSWSLFGSYHRRIGVPDYRYLGMIRRYRVIRPSESWQDKVRLEYDNQIGWVQGHLL